jgi:endonuclease/exonuclease/phosphatase family metal-dependent hydrolase
LIGRYDLSRISTVLREIDADIACLQEIEAARRSGLYLDQWAYLGFATGCRVVIGTGSHQARLRLGNAILTRFSDTGARVIDLSVAS